MTETVDDVNVELSDVIRSNLNEVCAKLIGSEKIDVNIALGSQKGDNYMGIVYRVVAKLTKDNANGDGIEDDENNNKSPLNVILKVAPTSAARREQFFSRICFLREIKLYDEIMPMFRRFQESRGIIPEENGFHEYPKCYRTIDTDKHETLIMQDMRTAHYDMFDRFQLITIDHVYLVMKTLGKYHALSFALRDQRPEEFQAFVDLPEVIDRVVDDSLRIYFKMSADNAINTLDQDDDGPLREKMNKLFGRHHMELIAECTNGKLSEPYSVLCHGDCWNNNILFKYDETRKPIDLCLLDWQIARYASPVTDLVYYIFCCTTKPLRDQYYDEMIKAYHDSLSAMITRLGSDPVKLFPFEAMQGQLKQFGRFGLVMATMGVPMITASPDQTPDLDEMADKFQNNDMSDMNLFTPDASLYTKRMRDIIVDMDRLGYI